MKIAHLILAHTEPLQLERLIGRLLHDDAIFFIHIDAKADIDRFKKILNNPELHWVRNRVNITWGAYSMVQATINGFRSIIETYPDIDMINLLSGSDYPLKSSNEIVDFFNSHPGQNFMELYSLQGEWEDANQRITQYHLNNFSFRGRFVVQKWMNRILPDRQFPKRLVAVGRSQLMTLTRDAVIYILDYLRKNPDITRYFKLTWAPDEMIFQTVLYNSPFKNQLINNNLRYIDWSAGEASPSTLTIDDLPKLLNSDKLFARKFDQKKYPEVLDALDDHLKGNSS
jgi:hypothetical protein